MSLSPKRTCVTCYTPESCPEWTATQTTGWFRPKSNSISSLLWGKEEHRWRSLTLEKYWVLKGAPGQTRKGGTASPRNRSQPPVAAAENHSSGNGWESRQPLQEKAQRLVWWKWCKHPKASTSQSPLLYKAPLQARWPCCLDSIQESLQ